MKGAKSRIFHKFGISFACLGGHRAHVCADELSSGMSLIKVVICGEQVHPIGMRARTLGGYCQERVCMYSSSRPSIPNIQQSHHPVFLHDEQLQALVSCARAETCEAVRLLAKHNRIIVEGAGAVSVAAALSGKAGTGKVACVVTGGNIDFDELIEIFQGKIPPP